MPLREIFRASEPSDVEAAQRRLAIAQALQARAMQGNVPEQHGSVASQYTPGNALVDLAAALTSAYNTKRAEGAYTRAKTAQGTKVAQATQELQTSTPDAQVGAQSLQNLRASPDGELPQTVTSRSAAQGDLASALGPDAQQQVATALLGQSMAPPKPVEPYTLGKDQVRFNDRNQKIAAGPVSPDEPKPLDELAKLNADHAAGRVSDADYKARRELMTTRAPPSAAAQGFDDAKIQALQASMALAGVSMPAGLRSQAQQLSVLKGLIARNPDKTPDEIVAGVRTGQLDFNGAKRSTAQLATAAAVTDSASRQIEKNFAAIEPLVSKVDATGRPIIDQAIAQLKRNWKSGGDKNTSAFVGYLKALAGEYAKIQSGGIGSAAPAEPELQAAMKIMTDAYSEGGYAGLKEAITTEAKNKQASYQEGLQNAASRSTAPPTTPPVAAPTGVPDDIAALLKKHGGK